MLAARFDAARVTATFAIDIPTLAVLATDVFDAFVERNRLRGPGALRRARRPRSPTPSSGRSFPPRWSATSASLVERGPRRRSPCAPRACSRTRCDHPFAGVYATKMIPNNQPDADTRFRRLVRGDQVRLRLDLLPRRARLRRAPRARGRRGEDGGRSSRRSSACRHGERFYPDVSGVARSYNFYPTGAARPEDGVVSLALGLGQDDRGRRPVAGPTRPRTRRRRRPLGSVAELLEQTQTRVLGGEHGPAAALRSDRRDRVPGAREPRARPRPTARSRRLASTYDAGSDRLRAGHRARGPRVARLRADARLDELPLSRRCASCWRRSRKRARRAGRDRVRADASASRGAAALRLPAGPPDGGRLGELVEVDDGRARATRRAVVASRARHGQRALEGRSRRRLRAAGRLRVRAHARRSPPRSRRSTARSGGGRPAATC